MDEIAVVMRKFGDEQSTLLDQFERLSFEVKLNQAILARSLSEPCMARSAPKSHAPPPPPPPEAALVSQVRQGRLRGSGLVKIFRKLLRPILGRKCSRAQASREAPKPSDLNYCKAFSKSLRFSSNHRSRY